MIEIKGTQFGFRIDPPLEGQPGDQVTLLSEDDGKWHEKTSFHSCWLRDLIAVATKADQIADTEIGPMK